MLRIAFVLKKFRKFMRGNATLADQSARDAFLRLELDKVEFLKCGGYKNVSVKHCFSFYRQLVLAKRDMEGIMLRSRFHKSRESSHATYISSDGEPSGEDVDDIDNPTNTPDGTQETPDDDVDDHEDSESEAELID